MNMNFEKYNSPDKLAKALNLATFACEGARRHLPPDQNLCRYCGLGDVCGMTFEEMVLYFESEQE